MTITPSNSHSHALGRNARAVVVYTSFAVGSTLAERLIDMDLIALVHLEDWVEQAWAVEAYDAEVVVLCPYLTTEEREGLLERCMRRSPPPGVIELTETPDEAIVVHCDDRRRERVDTVLRALHGSGFHADVA